MSEIKPLLFIAAGIVFHFLRSYYYADNIMPTIGIAVLVRNKEHSLPYFLSSLRQLKYPKSRLHLW